LLLTSLAVALSLGVAGACYDLTPIPPTGTGGGTSCPPDLAMPDACIAEPPDGGDVDAGDTDGDTEAATNGEPEPDAETDGGPSAEEPNP
jgi:hypothetical protein